jgi:hypothetical protein
LLHHVIVFVDLISYCPFPNVHLQSELSVIGNRFRNDGVRQLRLKVVDAFKFLVAPRFERHSFRIDAVVRTL